MRASPLQFGSPVLFVDDVPAVSEFYRKAFGIEQTFYDDQYQFAELNAGGVKLGIASHRAGELMMPGTYAKPKQGRPAGVELAFFTADVDAAFAKAVTAGATPLAAPKIMPWQQTVAYVSSIEGTIIGFCSPLENQPDAFST